jgi:hypothetical protein
MKISLLLLSVLIFAANAQANDVQLFNPDLFDQPTSVAIKLLFDKKPNEIESYMKKTDIKCGKYYAATVFYRGEVTFSVLRASLNKLYNSASSIAKCNTWGSHATLSVYAKTV